MPVNTVRYLATGSTDLDLALKVYSGNFAEAWRNQPRLFESPLPVIHRKMVEAAGSYQNLMFAETPSPELDYQPGPELLGQNFGMVETVITRDNYVVAHHWLPRDLKVTSHVDVIARLGRSDARRIKMEMDRRLFILSCLAARAAAVTKDGLTVHNGGNRVTRAVASGTIATAYPASATGAANFRADLRSLGRAQDEDNIPEGSRYLWVTPYLREVLLYDATGQVFSKDYQEISVNNVMARVIGRIDGFTLVDFVNSTSNSGSLPNENFTTGPSKYRANFATPAAGTTGTPVALVLAEGPEGDAAVSLGTWESAQNVLEYDPTRMSWFLASFILCGAGQMNPACAGSIEVLST